EVAFRKSTCFIRDLKGNDLLTGSHGTDLYSITLQSSNSPNPIYLVAKAASSQAWLWHRRLSHLNFDTINLLSKNDIVNMVAFLKKPQRSEDFHQIVDFLKASHIRTLDNREIELNETVDGQVKTITEASVKRHLKLVDADGISTLPTTEIFEQLALMGAVDEAITKEMHDGLGRATITTSSLAAKQGNGNISKTQTKATQSGPSSPRTSSEGGPGFHFTLGDSPIQDRPERMSNLPNEPPLGEDDADTSLDAKVSPKQGRMIAKIDKDENANLVKSIEQGEAHKTDEHTMESEFSTTSPQKDDDDTTLAETLLNIQRSAAKDKGKAKETARQEQENYNLEKALELQKPLDERKEDKGDQAHDIDWSDPSVLRYHALQNRPFSKAKSMGSKSYFVPKDYEIEKEVMKRSGFDLQQESLKKQKLDEQAEGQIDSDQEEDEMKKYINIVPDEEIAIDAIPLATKPLVIVA
nr:integrase, catalytic region, zinc finger, CCHC-type, peptidase aspartic, catalytic [Tanacetum cinerariifolium]